MSLQTTCLSMPKSSHRDWHPHGSCRAPGQLVFQANLKHHLNAARLNRCVERMAPYGHRSVATRLERRGASHILPVLKRCQYCNHQAVRDFWNRRGTWMSATSLSLENHRQIRSAAMQGDCAPFFMHAPPQDLSCWLVLKCLPGGTSCHLAYMQDRAIEGQATNIVTKSCCDSKYNCRYCERLAVRREGCGCVERQTPAAGQR